jgi:cis-3-alkyl-4-acyloxetan-2-one decarboxylase
MELILREQIEHTQLKQEYPFTSHYLKLNNNYDYHYVDEGQGEVMLMVHGNPTWSFYYRNLIKAFSRNHRVVVPDHLGCGLSDKPQDYQYTLANHIQNLKALVIKLDLRSITLVVHDWGGAIGMGLATQMPERIKGIVILNTAAFHLDRIPWQIGLCKNKFFGKFIVKHFNAFAGPATFMTTTKKLSPVIKAGYLLPYQNAHNRIAVAEFVQDIPMQAKHPTFNVLKEIELKLPTLKMPKLILWGGKDFCFNDLFFQKWRTIYPDAKFQYYENAGHYVIEDEKDNAIKMIQAFMEQNA